MFKKFIKIFKILNTIFKVFCLFSFILVVKILCVFLNKERVILAKLYSYFYTTELHSIIFFYINNHLKNFKNSFYNEYKKCRYRLTKFKYNL